MNLETITTKNYELQLQCEGDPDSPDIYIHFPGLVEHNRMPHVEKNLEFYAGLGYYAISPNAPGIFGSYKLNGSKDIADYDTAATAVSAYELIDILAMRALKKKNKSISVLVSGNSGGGKTAAWTFLRPETRAYISVLGAATWKRESNKDERAIYWIQDGSKDFYVIPPDGDELVKIEVPGSYTKYAQAYDSNNILSEKALRGKPKLIIGGTADTIALPSEVENVFDSTNEPKEIAWVDCNHFMLRGEAAEIQNKLMADRKKLIYDRLLTAEERSTRICEETLYEQMSYRDPEVIDEINELSADFLERHRLLPSQIGRLALRQS